MRPARGDSRPCTSSGCTGTMQFMRESDNDARRPERVVPATGSAVEDKLGWMCSTDAGHFRYGA